MFINEVPVTFNGTEYNVRVEEPFTYLENKDFLIIIRQIDKLDEIRHEHFTEYQRRMHSEYRVSAFHKRPKIMKVDNKEYTSYDIVSIINDVKIQTVETLQTLISALNNRK